MRRPRDGLTALWFSAAGPRRNSSQGKVRRGGERAGDLTIDRPQEEGSCIGNSADPLDRQPAEATPISVFLVDDYELVRRGLTDFLGSTADIVVVGEAGTCADALRFIPAAAPHIALLDSRLPDGSGIDLCRELRSLSPGVSCVILTAHHDDEALFAAVLAGASGYLLKQIRGSGLVDGIRQVAAGRSLLDSVMTKTLTDRLQ